jgi:hypothetical protein
MHNIYLNNFQNDSFHLSSGTRITIAKINLTVSLREILTACYILYAGFLLDFFFNPEDGD